MSWNAWEPHLCITLMSGLTRTTIWLTGMTQTDDLTVLCEVVPLLERRVATLLAKLEYAWLFILGPRSKPICSGPYNAFRSQAYRWRGSKWPSSTIYTVRDRIYFVKGALPGTAPWDHQFEWSLKAEIVVQKLHSVKLSDDVEIRSLHDQHHEVERDIVLQYEPVDYAQRH